MTVLWWFVAFSRFSKEYTKVLSKVLKKPKENTKDYLAVEFLGIRGSIRDAPTLDNRGCMCP